MKPKPITSWDEVPIVMDLPYASRIVKQHPGYLKQRAQRGTFPAYKEGNEWRVTKEDLLEYINSRRNGTATHLTSHPCAVGR